MIETKKSWHNHIVPRRPSIIPALVEESRPEKKNVVPFPATAKVKNPAAVALGKLGGSKGGRIRAERLSAEERKAIAQQAAQARWAKAKAKEAEDSMVRATGLGYP
jgi:hypothetical protein